MHKIQTQFDYWYLMVHPLLEEKPKTAKGMKLTP